MPTIDPEEWTLTVKGIIGEEVILAYEALLSMGLIEQYTTLARDRLHRIHAIRATRLL